MPGPILSSSSEMRKPRSRPGTESLANSSMPIVECRTLHNPLLPESKMLRRFRELCLCLPDRRRFSIAWENVESNCSLDFFGGLKSDGRMFCRRNSLMYILLSE